METALIHSLARSPDFVAYRDYEARALMSWRGVALSPNLSSSEFARAAGIAHLGGLSGGRRGGAGWVAQRWLIAPDLQSQECVNFFAAAGYESD